MLVLVLEASTSAAKALLYDERDGVVAHQSENYGPGIDSGGLHDARAVADAILRLGRAVAEGKSVDAIGLGCVWHTIMACDGGMNPLTPAHIWNYTGASEIAARFRADENRARDIYSLTGCMPNATYSLYNILLMREKGLDPAGKLFVSQGGYNFYRLTGKFCETPNVVNGMSLLNLRTGEYEPEMLDLCGIKPEQMGVLATFRQPSPLTAEAAKALGIRAGIPVVPAYSDGALNQLGNGAMRPGQMTFSVGTSAAIRLSSDRPVLSDPPATWCYHGVEDWMSGAATNGACNCVNWFKDHLLRDRWSFGELSENLLDRKPAPFFLPFLFSERCPGWNDARRGGFELLNGTEDAPTLFRSLSEGVLFNIYQCYSILARLCAEPERIILSGGIVNSPNWTQMAADVFGMPMHISDNPNASMLGGAAVALHAAGALDDISRFGVEKLEVVLPRDEGTAFYRERFKRYLELYDRLG